MTVFKRKVFYMGGFDPRGVRFYQDLYKQAAARWAELQGKDVAMSGRRRVAPWRADWTVTNASDGVETSYSFLRWEDLVQRAWVRNPLPLAGKVARAYTKYIRYMDWPKLWRMPRGPYITLFAPPLMSILLPVLIGLIPFLIALIWLPWWAALIIGAVAGVLGASPILKKYHAPWLLRFFIFNSETAGGEGDAELAARLDLFAGEILGELDGEWNEVLLVTHSNGSILSIPLMTRLLAARGGRMPANFSLITLGHCLPLVACRQDATQFRAQLAALADGDFHWVDVGSPPDGAAYCGVDPIRIVTDRPERPRIEHFSPRFHLFYEPESYHSGWSNKYEIHFDYLRTGDRISPMDYISLTAGPRPIADSIAEFRKIP